MRILLLFLILFIGSLPADAKPSAFRRLERVTFRISLNYLGPDMVLRQRFGTAFCVPKRPDLLMTAAHAVEMPNFTVKDYLGAEHETETLSTDKDNDIAILRIKSNACKSNSVRWAPRNAEPGERAWLLGFGGGFTSTPLLVSGIVSGRVFTEDLPGLQAFQVGALGGHSGGLAIDDYGRAIGMVVAGLEMKGHIDFMVPVETLKAAVK